MLFVTLRGICRRCYGLLKINEVLILKRADYLSWDEYFMGIAILSSLRSKDPSTQVGACIVNSEKRILSMGYNGMPR